MLIDPASVLAVIPARGGSKGIPRKNLRRVAGADLVTRSVREALKASRVGRVVVSTDDSEIEAAASRAGAEIVRRPDDISGDLASSEAALLHALDTLKRTQAYEPQLLVFLQCTSPLTVAEDIDGTIEALLREHADCAFAAASVHQFLWKRVDGASVGVNHDPSHRPRRQDREQEFVETGAVYVMRAERFAVTRHRFFGRIAMHEIPRRRWLEIDEPDDLLVAGAMATQEHRGVDALPARVSGVVFDFDGVFTDNRVVVLDDGREAVVCDRGDGWGIGELRAARVPMIVLSTERNVVVQKRCEKVGLNYRQALVDKLSALRAWATEQNIEIEHIVYLGNDRNDVECLQAAGCGVVVADAHPSALAVADLTLTSRGGHGAVRELTDLVLRKLGKDG